MHEMKTRTFPYNYSKEKILKEMSDLYKRCDEYHHGISRIDWDESKVFSSEEEAYNWLLVNRFGDYEQIAVPYTEIVSLEEQIKGKPRLESTYKKILDMNEKAEKAAQEYHELNNAFHFRDTKSELIGCKNCGSKLARKYLEGNKCPVCGHDLRPQSLLDRIAVKKAKVREYRKKSSDLMKEFKKKLKSEKYWIVKIEYHV